MGVWLLWLGNCHREFPGIGFLSIPRSRVPKSLRSTASLLHSLIPLIHLNAGGLSPNSILAFIHFSLFLSLGCQFTDSLLQRLQLILYTQHLPFWERRGVLGYSILTFCSGPALRLERIDPYHYNIIQTYLMILKVSIGCCILIQ